MSVAAVVLAAGASTRMGGASPKALLELDGATFLARIAATARAAGVSSVVVVAGPPHGALLRARLPPGAALAWNPDPSRGMITSVQVGLAELPARTVAALVWPVDQPAVRADTVRRVLDAAPGRIVIPRHAARGGHPVRIPRRHFGAVLHVPPDQSLKAFFDAVRDDVVHLDVDDAGVVDDVDTPADYERARTGASGAGAPAADGGESATSAATSRGRRRPKT